MMDFFGIQDLFKTVRSSIESKINDLKKRIAERVSLWITSLVVGFFICVLFLFCILFLSIGTAIYINHQLESMYNGFFIVSGFYLVITVLFIALRKPLARAVSAWFRNKSKT